MSGWPAEVFFAEREEPAEVDIKVSVRRADRHATLRPTSRGKIIGDHASMREVLATIERVATSNCTVLVTGPSGTGKELVVAALHDASPRASQPLVAVNCGAIPENLMESELFGHAKGAFTGAHAARQGRVAAAEGGTLFLDEIGELPASVQVKILRLLQQREYSPVGESRTIKCNIRVVAATNRDLEQEVQNGRFREDLFYRLDVIHLHLSALRDRASDIEALAMHFFRTCVERSGRTDLEGFTSEALELLTAYEWPGNVRALENVVERAVLLTAGPYVSVADLPPRMRSDATSGVHEVISASLPEAGIDLRSAVEQYENDLIRKALEKTGRNKNRAAQLLGVNRTTLVEMIKRKGL
jgi:DNA-binding NtrC family response regulator